VTLTSSHVERKSLDPRGFRQHPLTPSKTRGYSQWNPTPRRGPAVLSRFTPFLSGRDWGHGRDELRVCFTEAVVRRAWIAVSMSFRFLQSGGRIPLPRHTPEKPPSSSCRKESVPKPRQDRFRKFPDGVRGTTFTVRVQRGPGCELMVRQFFRQASTILTARIFLPTIRAKLPAQSRQGPVEKAQTRLAARRRRRNKPRRTPPRRVDGSGTKPPVLPSDSSLSFLTTPTSRCKTPPSPARRPVASDFHGPTDRVGIFYTPLRAEH